MIGSDQVLQIGPVLLGKPGSWREARNQLQVLRGRTHELITTVAVARSAGIVWHHTEVAHLTVRAFSNEALDRSSDALCTALQLTNFWQDFGRDWRAGRLYVPREVQRASGAAEARLAEGASRWAGMDPQQRARAEERMRRLRDMTPEARDLADVLVRATEAVARAVSGLRDLKRPQAVLEHCIEVNRLENAGDHALGVAIGKLFSGKPDPLEVMKWKEIYETVEEAIDKCEDVAHTLETILVKQA